MKTLTPKEATDLAYNTTGALMLFHAREIFDHCFAARLGTGVGRDPTWARYCAAAACYNAGRVDGIRAAERERRKKGKRKNKEGGVRNGGTHHHCD